MFHCYLHGWSSHEYMCPICSSNMTTSSNSVRVNTPSQPITEGQLKDLERRVDLVEKENDANRQHLQNALDLLEEAYFNFNVYNPTGTSKAGKTLKKIKLLLTDIVDK